MRIALGSLKIMTYFFPYFIAKISSQIINADSVRHFQECSRKTVSVNRHDIPAEVKTNTVYILYVIQKFDAKKLKESKIN